MTGGNLLAARVLDSRGADRGSHQESLAYGIVCLREHAYKLRSDTIAIDAGSTDNSEYFYDYDDEDELPDAEGVELTITGQVQRTLQNELVEFIPHLARLSTMLSTSKGDVLSNSQIAICRLCHTLIKQATSTVPQQYAFGSVKNELTNRLCIAWVSHLISLESILFVLYLTIHTFIRGLPVSSSHQGARGVGEYCTFVCADALAHARVVARLADGIRITRQDWQPFVDTNHVLALLLSVQLPAVHHRRQRVL